MNLRCFIAIGIPDQIKQEIRDLLDILKKYDVDVKWLVPENIHLTLKFLGSTPDILLTRINESILTIVSSYEPFYITICSTGVFPNKKYPRVIWAGVNSSEILMKLQNDIEHAMSFLGFKREDKEFKPHLTLGRVRSQRGIINVVNELENFRDKDFGTFTVQNIELMKSELNPKGAEYTCLYNIPLGTK